MPFTIAHISDLHFHAFPRHWQQWASKRALGAANLILRRRGDYPLERARKLVQTLEKLKWDHLVISGDLTTLALEEEFQTAAQTLRPLLKSPEKVTVIPGNHDRYVEIKTQPDYFQQYFGAYFGNAEIKCQQLTEDWHLLAWDSTHPNDWLTAAGTVSRKAMLASEAYMSNQPPQARFILVNHYPLWFPLDHAIHPAHELHNRAYVFHWVKQHPQIEIYLHGHIHQNWSHQMIRATTPLYLINSASSTAKTASLHQSAFHCIHLEAAQIKIEPLQF